MKHIERDISSKVKVPPPVDLGGRVEAKSELFQNMAMLHIKLKGMTHAATLLPGDTPSTLGLGQNIFLKKVMLDIKLKGMEHRAPCKHIFCPYKHPRPLGEGQKVKTFFFLKIVMLHIKLKGMEHYSTMQHMGMGSNIFSDSSHVAYESRELTIEHQISTHSVLTRTLGPGVRSKGQNFLSESSHVAYQIKGNGA